MRARNLEITILQFSAGNACLTLVKFVLQSTYASTFIALANYIIFYKALVLYGVKRATSFFRRISHAEIRHIIADKRQLAFVPCYISCVCCSCARDPFVSILAWCILCPEDVQHGASDNGLREEAAMNGPVVFFHPSAQLGFSVLQTRTTILRDRHVIYSTTATYQTASDARAVCQ